MKTEKPKRTVANQKGYTILEVMIASAVFAVVLIPTVALLGNVLIRYSTTDLITATYLARQEMERTLHDRAFEGEQKTAQIEADGQLGPGFPGGQDTQAAAATPLAAPRDQRSSVSGAGLGA